MKTHKVIGLMSGTSLDGLDIAYCEFKNQDSSWMYSIIIAETIEFPETLLNKLQLSPMMSGEDLCKFHNEFGRYIGHSVNSFIRKHKIKPDLISSHGHTIFHQPDNRFTLQIGSGAEIAAVTGIDTVCDFRSTDIALGGQGAPLVPIGDELLFKNYDYCLNIGGIANISTNYNNKRIAWDICPSNMLLNYYAHKLDFEYDIGGQLAKNGKANQELLNELLNIEYHKLSYPKSLGREYVFNHYLPIITKLERNSNNILRTLIEMISQLIYNDICKLKNGVILATGGGSFNTFLIEQMKAKGLEIVLPDAQTISYKEALIFAFLGLLRKNNQLNTLQSVTGSSRNSISGAIYSGK